MFRIRFFSTKGMYGRPVRGEVFRVGPWVGKCILSTNKFVVMLEK